MNEILVLDEESYEADHVKHSVGGMGGHLLRRATHLSLAFTPWLYYWHGENIAGFVGLNPRDFVLIVVGFLVTAEFVRLKIGFTIIGQRAYEAHQLSALFWGAISVGFALILSPLAGVMGAAFGLPLIFGLAFGDPVMGEARRAGKEPRMVFIAGLFTVYVVWLCSWNFLETPLLFALIIPPIQVASEWPRLRWIDDNGAMVLIPLVVVLLLSFIVL
jgi:hypothetical protein